VLDEPTNDLDLETLDLLQEQLADYAGTVLLVSHDRDFLDRVVTAVIAAEGDGRWIEYAGGYSDMLAQRGPLAVPAPATAKARRTAAEKPQAAPRPRKMTFKDRHALATLPGQIEALQAERLRLNAALADPDLYARNAAQFDRLTKALAVAEQNLADAEEQWLSLEMLREELEG
jgi:ABC transport system ATP-binding/permease protein